MPFLKSDEDKLFLELFSTCAVDRPHGASHRLHQACSVLPVPEQSPIFQPHCARKVPPISSSFSRNVIHFFPSRRRLIQLLCTLFPHATIGGSIPCPFQPPYLCTRTAIWPSVKETGVRTNLGRSSVMVGKNRSIVYSLPALEKHLQASCEIVRP